MVKRIFKAIIILICIQFIAAYMLIHTDTYKGHVEDENTVTLSKAEADYNSMDSVTLYNIKYSIPPGFSRRIGTTLTESNEVLINNIAETEDSVIMVTAFEYPAGLVEETVGKADTDFELVQITYDTDGYFAYKQIEKEDFTLFNGTLVFERDGIGYLICMESTNKDFDEIKDIFLGSFTPGTSRSESNADEPQYLVSGILSSQEIAEIESQFKDEQMEMMKKAIEDYEKSLPPETDDTVVGNDV